MEFNHISLTRVVLAAMMSLAIAGCGDDDPDTDAGTVTQAEAPQAADNTPADNSQPSSEPRAETPAVEGQNSGDTCIINNIVLDPPSGATLNKGDTLRIKIDYTLRYDVTERVIFNAYLRSVDGDDYTDSGQDEYFTGSGDAGRYINGMTLSFDESYWYNDTDRYTSLIVHHGPSSGCDVRHPVNYIILND